MSLRSWFGDTRELTLSTCGPTVIEEESSYLLKCTPCALTMEKLLSQLLNKITFQNAKQKICFPLADSHIYATH